MSGSATAIDARRQQSARCQCTRWLAPPQGRGAQHKGASVQSTPAVFRWLRLLSGHVIRPGEDIWRQKPIRRLCRPFGGFHHRTLNTTPYAGDWHPVKVPYLWGSQNSSGAAPPPPQPRCRDVTRGQIAALIKFGPDRTAPDHRRLPCISLRCTNSDSGRKRLRLS